MPDKGVVAHDVGWTEEAREAVQIVSSLTHDLAGRKARAAALAAKQGSGKPKGKGPWYVEKRNPYEVAKDLDLKNVPILYLLQQRHLRSLHPIQKVLYVIQTYGTYVSCSKRCAGCLRLRENGIRVS